MAAVVPVLNLLALVLVDFGGPSLLAAKVDEQFGSGVLSSLPARHQDYLSLYAVIAWTLGTSIGYGGDVAPMAGAMEGQRILPCRNAREASQMYFWTEAGVLCVLCALSGLAFLSGWQRFINRLEVTAEPEPSVGFKESEPVLRPEKFISVFLFILAFLLLAGN